jgi:hypothetical protein
MPSVFCKDYRFGVNGDSRIGVILNTKLNSVAAES